VPWPALLVLALLTAAGAGAGQEPPARDSAEIFDALAAGLGAFGEVTGAELQAEVAALGGVPFRRDVPLSYMTRGELAGYLHELFDDEYPEQKARADQRMLVAFDLLPPQADLRKLRWQLLEDNVAGFYDERPGRKRLYAISLEKRLTPSNQMILSHELRHALQDQYTDVHGMFPESVSDFDDRRLAFLSLLEGDATYVMERFLLRRLGADGDVGLDFSGLGLPGPPLAAETPPVLKDQLLMPYVVGRDLAAAVWRHGGWDALREAWTRPPVSTEQVLHPDKFLSREPPSRPELGHEPKAGRVIQEGVLGELLTRTLLGKGSEQAAAGWGGDQYRVWDLSGRTLLLWRSSWDTPADKREFVGAAVKAFAGRRGEGVRRRRFLVFGGGAWTYAWGEQPDGVVFVSSDSPDALEAALKALESSLLPVPASRASGN
jgi:hypothetical protein